MHKTGEYVFPDYLTFRYYAAEFKDFPKSSKRLFYNAEDQWYWKYRPKHGDVIIDVGAGRGEYVLPFSIDVGPSGRVIAIEAEPNTFMLLTRLCEKNRMDNVTRIQCAVTGEPGAIEIECVPADEAETWYLHSTVDESQKRPMVRVPGRTLDEICDEHKLGRVDFLKMNIEGAERLALPGMKRTLAMTRSVCIACHDFRAERGHGDWFRSRKEVDTALREAGFTVVTRPDHQHDFVRDHLYGVR